MLAAAGRRLIGVHPTTRLFADGHDVTCADREDVGGWYQPQLDAQNITLILQSPYACGKAVRGIDRVFNLASDTDGLDLLENRKAESPAHRQLAWPRPLNWLPIETERSWANG